MEIIKVKIRDKKTGIIYEVKKALASDYIGTGDFELVKDEKKDKNTNFYKSEKY